MPNEFLCSCGTTVALDESVEDGTLLTICPNCGQAFVGRAGAEPFKPLIEQLPAKILAWGCLLPVGFLIVVFAIGRAFDDRPKEAIDIASTGVVILALCGWMFKRQRCTTRGFAAIACVSLPLMALLTHNFYRMHQTSTALDARFATVLAQMDGRLAKQTKPDGEPRSYAAKCLPVNLNEPGYEPHARKPYVNLEVYEALAPKLRAGTPEEVRTIILLDWWYEKSGTYRSMDEFKHKAADIYRGGCTIRFIDRESNTLLSLYRLIPPDNAPKTRSGDDVTTWYGFQPTDKEVLEYIQTLKSVN